MQRGSRRRRRHRRRRGGCGTDLAPRQPGRRRGVSRAGRLAPAFAVRVGADELRGAAPARQSRPVPGSATAARRLPDRDGRCRPHRHGDVERRGRQHGALGRPLPAPASVGLSRAPPRRRRRRLANRLSRISNRSTTSTIATSASLASPAILPTRGDRRAQTPPLPLGPSGAAVVRGFEKLGWHWWPSDNAILSRDYDGRPAATTAAAATSAARSGPRHRRISPTGRKLCAPAPGS